MKHKLIWTIVTLCVLLFLVGLRGVYIYAEIRANIIQRPITKEEYIHCILGEMKSWNQYDFGFQETNGETLLKRKGAVYFSDAKYIKWSYHSIHDDNLAEITTYWIIPRILYYNYEKKPPSDIGDVIIFSYGDNEHEVINRHICGETMIVPFKLKNNLVGDYEGTKKQIKEHLLKYDVKHSFN